MTPTPAGALDSRLRDAAADFDALHTKEGGWAPTAALLREAADALQGGWAELIEALQFIAELDPNDTSSGFNEWGEAECFKHAQQTARVVLARVELINKLCTPQWKTIDSAPKDGNAILGWSPDYEHPFVVFWGNPTVESGCMPALPEGSTFEHMWLLANAEECRALQYEPTYWMPSPPAPTTAAGEES